MKLLVLALLAAPALSACALGGAGPAADATATPADPALEGLPPGEARDMLAGVCTECHDLGGLDAYRGYWGYGQWRDMVQTMIDHGAKLDERQANVLADYLTEHFGPDA